MLTPTVKVYSDETECGYMIINQSDFDPSVHESVDEDGHAESAPLPAVSKLAAHLETITEIGIVRAMQERDTRKSAASLYDARLAVLLGESE